MVVPAERRPGTAEYPHPARNRAGWPVLIIVLVPGRAKGVSHSTIAGRVRPRRRMSWSSRRATCGHHGGTRSSVTALALYFGPRIRRYASMMKSFATSFMRSLRENDSPLKHAHIPHHVQLLLRIGQFKRTEIKNMIQRVPWPMPLLTLLYMPVLNLSRPRVAVYGTSHFVI